MTDKLINVLHSALDDLKAKDLTQVDVRGKSDVTDVLMIASGTSNRHVKSLASSAVEDAKQAGFQPLGVEGLEGGEWVLVDFGDIVLHVMKPDTREFYDLEKLWSVEPAGRSAD
ncbi:ribosome silencing factor [Gilvimarinus agarilyticus]|uniref:ribosome silencing factor n=1 Tax=unclassified Gilvimarinus TaxID=2642066 RepID=UPI001C0823A1|nr:MULTISPECIES: ribosome silencing factor [unclassified Gilvimarinus]MBU2887618.1 ribosome silencing factor [Gilvimarinus agarilyticus]MDO6572269.1 ribosome silencing factor [Gilvimarinus sp. 2_MG-2023]MDO6746836.1 ribosome silencing factor [Gilvimarinus sp. 1_MG-2023]